MFVIEVWNRLQATLHTEDLNEYCESTVSFRISASFELGAPRCSRNPGALLRLKVGGGRARWLGGAKMMPSRQVHNCDHPQRALGGQVGIQEPRVFPKTS